MKITGFSCSKFGRIMFNDLVHLHLEREGFIGFTSWVERDENNFVVEFTYDKGAIIKCEYDVYAKFSEVLKVVEGITKKW